MRNLILKPRNAIRNKGVQFGNPHAILAKNPHVRKILVRNSGA